MKNLGIFSLLLLLFLSSCRKDINLKETTETTPNPTVESYVPAVDLVNGSVIGFIVDENNQPVAEATVKLNNNTFTTDDYGHFFVEDQSMNALGALVSVEKNGYFQGSRRFFPTEGKQSRIKIQLLEKTFNHTFNTSSGGTITLDEGAAVAFSANSIKTESGDAYNGNVNVAIKWMNPSDLETLDQMPGNLQGIDGQVEQVALATYGMVAVELQGDAGEPLNIADGQTATLTMPVPNSMLSGAPATIPLWSYHEELGLWIEEATATLQGDQYVGEVTHFSFWNCDIPMDYVDLEMTLVDENNTPLNNYLVTLTLNTGNNELTSGSGYTNQFGNVSGFVPANQILDMEVFDYCGDILSSQQIGPFDVDTDIGEIVVTGIAANTTTITGNLLDCNGMEITNGVVIAEFNGHSVFQYTTTSNFSMSFSSCNNTSTVNVTAANLDNLEQSGVLSATPNVSTDLGDINVCGNQLTNYITITIDGTTAIFANVTVQADSLFTYFQSVDPDQSHFVGVGFPGITTGDYTNDVFMEGLFSSPLGWNYGEGTTFSSFLVTQYDTEVAGTFEGQVIDQTTGNTLPMSGAFNIDF